jgi:tripartite-type tricarboxylate transporter receptor subunit TctC
MAAQQAHHHHRALGTPAAPPTRSRASPRPNSRRHLNQKIVILNQPGASGSVGTKNAMEAPKDGYTWTAGAAKDLGTYKVLGMVDTSVQDWNLYLNVAHIAVVGVNADTPYKTMAELIAAMKARPGRMPVATAGVNSSGHSAIEAIARAAGVYLQARHLRRRQPGRGGHRVRRRPRSPRSWRPSRPT